MEAAAEAGLRGGSGWSRLAGSTTELEHRVLYRLAMAAANMITVSEVRHLPVWTLFVMSIVVSLRDERCKPASIWSIQETLLSLNACYSLGY